MDFINKATLAQKARQHHNGEKTIKTILSICDEVSEHGRGAYDYYVGNTPDNNVIEGLRSYGLEVSHNTDSGCLHIVWDQELENLYQENNSIVDTPDVAISLDSNFSSPSFYNLSPRRSL